MAKNMWKYASLSEKERLGRIRNGDNDVYNTEIARLDYLSGARKSLGFETKDIEDWRTLVNQAKSASSEKQPYKVSPSKGLPKFYSGNTDKTIGDFYSYMSSLNKKLSDDRNAALTEAAQAKTKLDEWLSTNGLSADGGTAARKSTEIENNLSDELEKLYKTYSENAKSARTSALKKLAK